MPVNISSRDAQRLVKQLARAAANVPKELSRATISIARAAKTETKRAAASVYNVSQARIAEDLSVTSGDRRVTIEARKKPISVKSYRAVQTKRGLAFTVIKGGKRATLKRGFITKSSKVTLQRVGKPRLPVAGVYGPSTADMLNRDNVQKPLTRKLSDRAVREIANRIGRLRGG